MILLHSSSSRLKNFSSLSYSSYNFFLPGCSKLLVNYRKWFGELFHQLLDNLGWIPSCPIDLWTFKTWRKSLGVSHWIIGGFISLPVTLCQLRGLDTLKKLALIIKRETKKALSTSAISLSFITKFPFTFIKGQKVSLILLSLLMYL